MDQLPRLGKRELSCLLLFTCNYWRGFLFLWVLGMGYVILLWHSEPSIQLFCCVYATTITFQWAAVSLQTNIASVQPLHARRLVSILTLCCVDMLPPVSYVYPSLWLACVAEKVRLSFLLSPRRQVVSRGKNYN